jgi:hypothetical protein
MGSGHSPLSCGVFLPLPLLQAFPFLVSGCVLPLLPSPASLFIYSSVRDFPSPLFYAQGAPPSLLCVFFVIAYFSVSFFPWVGVVCPGGYAQGCLWETPSPCGLCLLQWSGCWHLSVAWEPSWFLHLMWRCYAWAGGVEESNFTSSWWFFL